MNTIHINQLTKQAKGKMILKSLSFHAEKGKVTALLGPNGSGKSSTLRILLGLDYSSSGSALFGGKQYKELTNPLQTVGAVFDGHGGVPSRTVFTHLNIMALSNQIHKNRITEVFKMTGLHEKKSSKLGSLSLGEGQRLGLAGALLGNPQYLVLDEPTNGLDPFGMQWFKQFIRSQADEGKTILLSSHFLNEVEDIADEVIFIQKGKVKEITCISAIKNNVASLEESFFSVINRGEENG